MSIQVLCLLLNQVVFVGTSLVSVYPGYQSLLWYANRKYFLPFCGFPWIDASFLVLDPIRQECPQLPRPRQAAQAYTAQPPSAVKPAKQVIK